MLRVNNAKHNDVTMPFQKAICRFKKSIFYNINKFCEASFDNDDVIDYCKSFLCYLNKEEIN